MSDLFLGWFDGMPGTNRQFYGRQLHDMKGAFADAVEVFAGAESHFVAGDHRRLTDAIAAGELDAADIEDV